MKFFFAVTVLSISGIIAGCSASTDSNTGTTAGAADDLSTKTLSGTYAISSKEDATPYNSIVLKTDHDFSAQGGCRPNPSGPSCFAITAFHGTWKLLTSGPQLGSPAGAPQIEFTDSEGNVNTYFYTLQNDQLSVSETFDGKQSVFNKDISAIPTVGSGDECADKNGNTVGQCDEAKDLYCEYDGPSATTQHCLPPI
jgi:hypothetical protein